MKDKIFSQLRHLNILPGDTLFINIDMFKFGLFKGYKRKDYLDIFLEYLGPKGTLIGLSYTETGYLFMPKRLPIFDHNKPATTGAFSNLMLSHKDKRRSRHPTNSVVAIGNKSDFITKDIDENSGAYEFFRKIIKLEGKLLLVGCEDFPGFLTHLVEIDLGRHKQYWTRYLFGCRLENGKIFIRRDPGGCSKTFFRLYPFYRKENVLKEGQIGNANALSITALDAYRIDKRVISNDPSILICDDKNCFRCRAERWVTIWNFPFLLTKKLIKRIINAK